MKILRKPRIPKSVQERIRECETHLYFLWDARRLYSEQRERYKQIAAELRILVCETRTNDPLLLGLMDQYDFHYDVHPVGTCLSGPPLKRQPISTVGWGHDPNHKETSDRLANAIKSGDEEEMARIERRLAELARPIPFRDWVNKGLAVFIRPYDYSHRDLVLVIAQQCGSSHEDGSVEEPIVRARYVHLGGESGDIAPLITFADSVISVGSAFIGYMVEHRGFEPRYFRVQRSQADPSC